MGLVKVLPCGTMTADALSSAVAGATVRYRQVSGAAALRGSGGLLFLPALLMRVVGYALVLVTDQYPPFRLSA
jgi:hypothetical protein